MVFENAEVPRRHGKSIIEAALTTAGDMDERTIEGWLAHLVHIEAAQQHGLNQPARLGYTEDQTVLRGRRSIQWISPQFTDPGHAERNDDRIARSVGQFVDVARLKTTLELDLSRSAANRLPGEGQD